MVYLQPVTMPFASKSSFMMNFDWQNYIRIFSCTLYYLKLLFKSNLQGVSFSVLPKAKESAMPYMQSDSQ